MMRIESLIIWLGLWAICAGLIWRSDDDYPTWRWRLLASVWVGWVVSGPLTLVGWLVWSLAGGGLIV